MQITIAGLDLAKNVFQLHGVSRHGKVELRKQLKRDQVAPFFTNLPACLIGGVGACSSAHHWARKLQTMGHTVRLMAPQFVVMVAGVGDARNSDNGRQFSAWLAVVPRQHSSGGKPTLLGMSKRGDAYLRTMLIHGARSVIYRATQRADAESWSVKLTAPEQEDRRRDAQGRFRLCR